MFLLWKLFLDLFIYFVYDITTELIKLSSQIPDQFNMMISKLLMIVPICMSEILVCDRYFEM